MKAASTLLSLVGASLQLVASAALAAPSLDGNKLYEYCAAKEGFFQSGLCSGYIFGVVDGLSTAHIGLNAPAPFCVPQGVTNGQIVDVVVRYFEATPEQRHFTAASTIAVALMKAFPCKK